MKMDVKIGYAGCCLTGLVRVNNEDNYSCAGEYLPLEHSDRLPFEGTAVPGRSSAFAVFDGMGGEACGEAASYIAAKSFSRAFRHSAMRAFPPVQEPAICRHINRQIVEYAKENRAPGCGTTAVTLCFDTEDIHGFNLGDSRCYRFSRGQLSALSTDHTVTSPITRRSRLTQCLGIPEHDFLVEPALYRADYLPGDLFLLCSDGLTGFVSPVTIESVLAAGDSLSGKLSALTDAVFQRGAGDNVTILLFEILAEDT